LSKIALEGNASGTGTFTLASPNSSTDRTLDLPDASGVIDRLNRAGNVLQVVNATYSTQATTTSGTYASMGLSASITPSSTSSKILLIARIPVRSSGFAYGSIRWLRNSTVLSDPPQPYESGITTNSDLRAVNSYVIYDSPNTTSSVTYSTEFVAFVPDGSFIAQPNSMISQVILMEIAG
jgi:hypothetical protein